MSTLHDRLADLAEDAPAGAPEPGLWERGQRIDRRRRVGTAAIALLVIALVSGLSVVTWRLAPPTPVPAGPTDARMRLPDRFYDPSGRVGSTADDGPLGRLVAVVGSEEGPVGVAATTGEYRRLDLPGWSGLDDTLGASEVTLSSDGRWVGYWTVQDGVVRGVSAYDAVTDQVEQLDVPSDFGLSPNGLAWVGDRLWFSAFAFTDDTRTGARGTTSTVWSVRTDRTDEIPLGRSPAFGNATTTRTYVVESDGSHIELFTPDGRPPRKLAVATSFGGAVAATSDGSEFAVVHDPEPNVSDSSERRPVVVLRPDGHGGTTAHRIPHVRTSVVLAWRDDQHVVVWTYGAAAAYQAVDIRTGESTDLTRPSVQITPGLVVAADAWTAPVYPAPALPPRSHSTLLACGFVVLGLGGLLALMWWRRRVRP